MVDYKDSKEYKEDYRSARDESEYNRGRKDGERHAENEIICGIIAIIIIFLLILFS